MEAVVCHEEGCENIIEPDRMEYAREYYVLVDLCAVDPNQDFNAQYIIDEGLARVYCGVCGYLIILEIKANGFDVVSRRKK